MPARVVLVTACSLAAVLAWTSDASGVIGGEIDGNAHPNVGLVLLHDELSEELGPLGFCTGTLIKPTIVLTAAHCVNDPAITSVEVTFDPDPLPTSFPGVIEGAISGTAYWHPRFSLDTSSAREFYDMTRFDIAVIVLDEPVVGIAPAQLPTRDALESFATGSRNRLFTVVGYGTYRDVEPPKGRELEFDGVRRRARVSFKKLTDTLLYVRLNSSDNHGTGGGCFGDSGGPIYLGQTVVGIYTGVQNDLCQTWGSYTRLDTGPARTWLAQFVSLP